MDQFFGDRAQVRSPVQRDSFVDGVKLSKNLGTIVPKFDYVTLDDKLAAILDELAIDLPVCRKNRGAR